MNKQVVIAGLKRLERHLRKKAQHEDNLVHTQEGYWVVGDIKSECYSEVADLVHAEITRLEALTPDNLNQRKGKHDGRTHRGDSVTKPQGISGPTGA